MKARNTINGKGLNHRMHFGGGIVLASLLTLSQSTWADVNSAKPASPVNTVAAILDNPVDDQAVVLDGQLVRQVQGERYLFSDDSGEITVEIDDDEMPRGGIELNQRIRLIGEVDVDRSGDVEIEVEWLDAMRASESS